jgi:hypothetical protein
MIKNIPTPYNCSKIVDEISKEKDANLNGH